MLDIEAGDQRHQVAQVRGRLIARCQRQPVAVTAAGKVDADDAVAVLKRCRQSIEIAAATGETVDAYEHVVVAGVTPLEIGEAVESVRPEAEEPLGGHGHGDPPPLSSFPLSEAALRSPRL